MMWKSYPISLPSCLVIVLIGAVTQTHGRIRVLSTLDDETVYVIHEKPIIDNIDSPEKGMLVISNPINACGPVVPPPDNTSFNFISTYGNTTNVKESPRSENFVWILLVSWSTDDDCSLRSKAESAYLAGYSVVLLPDPSNSDNDSEPLFSALSPLSTSTANFDYGWTDASVYACTINPEDWDILKRNFTSEEYYLSFEDSNSMGGWFTYFIVGILAIGAVFFTIGLSYVLVQLLVLILLWIRESIVSRIQQIRRDRRRRLPASQLKKIPIQQWNTDMLQDICSICLESFVMEDRVRILPCSHVFHQICIDPWLLKQRRKCPNCKRKIVFPDENRDSDSSSDDERTPLLRRSSSTRDNSSRPMLTSRQEQESAPTHLHQSPGHVHRQPIYGIHQFANANLVNSNNGRHSELAGDLCDQGQEHFSSLVPATYNTDDSSVNTSTEVSDTAPVPNSSQAVIKEKVDQLCARMETVGRKIRKKAKANQASKLDNDSSSDLSTTVQPVIVGVTVESNNFPDSDCETYHEESHTKEQPSSSSQNSSQNSNSQFVPKLEVKVVPDISTMPSQTQQTLPGNSESMHGAESSIPIPSDLNA